MASSTRGKGFSPAVSSDFLELQRFQRLHSNVVTPAVSLRAADQGASRCFGRGLATVPEDVSLVREVFRSYDRRCPGCIDAKWLARVLRTADLTDDEIAKLLRGAEGVGREGVDYEVGVKTCFERRGNARN